MVLRNKLSVSQVSYTRLSRSLADHSGSFCYRKQHRISSALQPHLRGLACSAFAHRYWRNLIWFIFLALLRCFSSRRSQPNPNITPCGINFMFGHSVKQSRFPHSETAGSKVYGTSPTSIAAVCVLPRSKSPRHPLLALISKFKTFLSRIMPWIPHLAAKLNITRDILFTF